MKKTKTILSVLLTAVMLLTMFTAVPFSAFAAGDFTKNYDVSTASELTAALREINAADSGTYSITLKADISYASGEPLEKNSATIFGEGHTINFTGMYQVFPVQKGATLNLGSSDYNKTLILNGDNSIVDNDNPGLIYVLGSATTVNMYNGVTIKNHTGSNYLGGGVSIEAGKFNMYGGTIENCKIDNTTSAGGHFAYGGGVAVYNGGKFTMNGGTIKNCSVLGNSITSSFQTPLVAGGGVAVIHATFTMNGGIIDNCTAENYNSSTNDGLGGGVALLPSKAYYKANGYKVGYLDATFIMNNNSKITNCYSDIGGGAIAAGFRYAEFDNALTEHAEFADYDYNTSGVYINGGEISDNESAYGGGVFVNIIRKHIPVEIKNAKIENNSASYGGGISIFGNYTQPNITNCDIKGNDAYVNGGGIHVYSNNGDGTKGTTLTDNTMTANKTQNGLGSGVYYDGNSILNISGANTIQDNYYGSSLNNLNVYSVSNPVNVVGDLTGSKVGLSDPRLWGDNMTDAEAPDNGSAELLTNGYKANNPDVHPSEYFTSDHETWFVDRTSQTITKIDDPNSKSYREYTVKRYEYIPASDPKMNPLYGQPNEYVVSDIKNPDIQNITSFADLYNEIKYKYSDTSKYTKGPDVNSNGNIYLKYDILDNTYPTSVTLQKQNNNNYATIVFSQSPMTGKGGSITYRVFLSDQTSYANSKEIVYRIGGNSSLTQYYVFSDTYTTKTVIYVNATPPSDTLYEYDDYGNLIAKLEIEGGKDNYTIQTTQIETVTGNDNEVRLVRRTTPIKFHTNNPMVTDETTRNNELFRVYNADKEYTTEDGANHSFNNKGGVDEFYSIPKFAEDDYVFAGWYTVADNDNNDKANAFEFGSFVSPEVEDVYAHWISVGTVDKDGNDDKELPSGMFDTYSGFGLFGVQIRPEAQFDYNMGEYYYGGLRFISSISESLLSDIDDLSTEKVGSNNVEYGYVTAAKSTIDTVADNADMHIDKSKYKIQYKGDNVNGVDTLLNNATSEERKTPNNFRYVTNVDCTSKYDSGNGKVYGNNPRVKIDHKNFSGYRLMTFVVNYTGENAESDKGKDVVARAYIRYYDANGLLRTFYNDYGGTNVYGGCSTSFNTVKNAITGDIKTEVKK